jgi:hypothetical protein
VKIAGCGVCMRLTCIKCSEQRTDGGEETRKRVLCMKPEAAERVKATGTAMTELSRGMDWQICSDRKHCIQRSEGRNYMRCNACGAQFCYVCGCSANTDVSNDHWKGDSRADDKCLFIGIDHEGAAKYAGKRSATRWFSVGSAVIVSCFVRRSIDSASAVMVF